jgi:uncharacterized membrane protein YsdA (DUF1294 family)/cold shock CspA family protein
MRKEGIIVRWDEAKGFGFIRSDSIAQEVFVHVRDYRIQGNAPLHDGARVSFEHIHVGGKGPRAVAVQLIGAAPVATVRPRVQRASVRPARSRTHRSGSAPKSGAWLALPLMPAYGLSLARLVWQWRFPWWILPASFLLNLATFFAYWQDKYAAQQGRWRIREDTLHFWSLAGGWAGAWFAQQILRHKSRKTSFRDVYWATVVIHCAAVAGWWWWLNRR